MSRSEDEWVEKRVALGRAIREVREEHGKTVSELATATGISERTILRVESGSRESDYELLVRLARGLGGSPSAFFVRAEEHEPLSR